MGKAPGAASAGAQGARCRVYYTLALKAHLGALRRLFPLSLVLGSGVGPCVPKTFRSNLDPPSALYGKSPVKSSWGGGTSSKVNKAEGD